MRRMRSFIAMFMALLIAVTSINIPQMAVYAQDMSDDSNESHAQLATASDAVTAEEGITKFVLSNEEDSKKFSFVPEDTSAYQIYTVSDTDTYATLYDEEGEEIKYAYSGGTGNNFRMTCRLAAGNKYELEVSYDSWDEEVTAYDIELHIEKLTAPSEITFGTQKTNYLEKVDGNYFSDPISASYPDGTVKKGYISYTDVIVDGVFKYKLCIKDSNGSYSYESGGYTNYYGEALEWGSLPIGTYTVEITDKIDDGNKPADGSKIYDTCTIHVLSAKDYFAGRTDISETEERQFAPSISEDGYEFYKFTPSETAKYMLLFSCEDYEIDTIVYDSSYKEVTKETNGTYSFSAGNDYYVGLHMYDYPEDGTGKVGVRAHLYSEPVSAVVNLDSEYMTAFGIEGSQLLDGVSVDLTYADNSTETVKEINEDSFMDSTGLYFSLYFSKQGEKWDETRIDSSELYGTGTYTFSIGFDGKQIYSKEIKIQRFDKYELPELKEGQQEIRSGVNAAHTRYYYFVMPYDGCLDISQHSEYNLYTISADGSVSELDNYSWNLKKGTKYYVGFYGYLRGDDDENYIPVNSWQANVKFSSAVVKMSVEPAKTKFIMDIDDSYIDGAVCHVVYSDGSFEDIVADSSIYTKYCQNIDVIFKQGNNEYENMWDLPKGKSAITFKSGDKLLCSYDIQVYDLDDLTIGNLKVGDNEIRHKTGSDMPSYYKFTAPADASFSFGPCETGEIYYKYSSYDEYESKTGYSYAGQNTYGSSYDVKADLKKGTDYYIKVSDGAKDRWGDIQYNWNMKITNLGELTRISSWTFTKDYNNQTFAAGITDKVLAGLLGGVSMKITYSDNTSEILEWTGDNLSNKKDQYIYYKISEKEDDDIYDDIWNSKYNKLENLILTEGSYKLSFRADYDEYSEAGYESDEIAFEVKNIKDTYDEIWDVTKPLTVKNDKPVYIYKLNVPSDKKALTFISNASGTDMSLISTSGKAQTLYNGYDGTYSNSWSCDIPEDGAYLFVYPSSEHPVTKITAVDVRKATEVTVTVDKGDYYEDYNDFSTSHIHVNVKYADGEKEEFSDNNGSSLDYVKLNATDAAGNDHEITNYMAAGTYKISAAILNMSEDCKVTPAIMTIKSADTDQAAQIETGKTYTDKNVYDYEKVIFYRYEAPATGKVRVDTNSELVMYKNTGRTVLENLGNATYKVQKGGLYLVMLCVAPDIDSSIKIDYSEYEHEIGGSLVLDENKAIKIGAVSRIIDYTFVPTESGAYELSLSHGSGYKSVSLYQGDKYISDVSYDSANEIYKVNAYLKKGVTYTYVVTASGDEGDTFAIRLEKGAKNPTIQTVSVIPDSYVYWDKERINGKLKVTYSDGTDGEYELYYYCNYEPCTRTDDYDNKIQAAFTILNTGDEPAAIIELRYKSYNSDSWVYSKQIQVALTKKSDDSWENAKFIKTLESGEKYTGTGNYNDSLCFKFVPEKDGQYFVDSKNLYCRVKDLDTDKEVISNNNKYNLKAGHTYGILLEVYYSSSGDVEYYICINNVDSVSDVEILGYDGKAYRQGGCENTDKYLQIRITYADGSSQVVNGGEKLGDGRRVDCSWTEYDDKKVIVTAKADGISDRYIIRYSALESAPDLIFTDNVAELRIPGAESESYPFEKQVYRMTVPETGEYTAVRNSLVRPYGVTLYNEDGTLKEENENNKYSLVKGENYYIVVKIWGTNIVKFGLAYDGIWETTREATCIETGSMRRKNLLTGNYETKTIPKKDHDYSMWQVTPATTTTTGVKKLVCSMCKVESGRERTIAKIGTITLSRIAYTYDGKVKKPVVTIMDTNGTKLVNRSYSVEYLNNRNVGKAKVKITFKGNYSGSVVRSFTINPAKTSVTKLENTAAGVKITWKKSASASGYLVYRKTSKSKYTLVGIITKNSTLSFVDKKATNGTGYTYKVVARKLIGKASYKSVDSNVKTIVRLSASGVNKLTNEKGNKMKVTWGKNTKAAGYQIQYSVKSNFAKAKVVKVTGARKTSATIAKLAKKKYYVRVRSFKKVGKTTYYSAWSKSANITIKK